MLTSVSMFAVHVLTEVSTPRIAVCIPLTRALRSVHYDPREPLPIDRRPFIPDHRDPGLSLTCPENRPAEKNSKRK